MNPNIPPSSSGSCPFHHGDSGFLDGIRERVDFVRRPHAKIYKKEDITLSLVQQAFQEFSERWQNYEFGQSVFRDLVGSIGAILIRWALKRFRDHSWPDLTPQNYQKLLPDILKQCVEQESVSFYSEIPDGDQIHTLLDTLSVQATERMSITFTKKPHLRGVTFVEFIKHSQVSTAFGTLDKILSPLCRANFSRDKFDAILHDSGLHLLRDIAWGGNHLEHRIIVGVAAFGNPPALSRVSQDGEALEFQISPHQLFQEGSSISHFSCWALFQPGNDGYKNLFEEFVLTLWDTYGNLFSK